MLGTQLKWAAIAAHFLLLVGRIGQEAVQILGKLSFCPEHVANRLGGI